jgi:hypothetical protein
MGNVLGPAYLISSHRCLFQFKNAASTASVWCVDSTAGGELKSKRPRRNWDTKDTEENHGQCAAAPEIILARP